MLVIPNIPPHLIRILVGLPFILPGLECISVLSQVVILIGNLFRQCRIRSRNLGVPRIVLYSVISIRDPVPTALVQLRRARVRASDLVHRSVLFRQRLQLLIRKPVRCQSLEDQSSESLTSGLSDAKGGLKPRNSLNNRAACVLMSGSCGVASDDGTDAVSVESEFVVPG